MTSPYKEKGSPEGTPHARPIGSNSQFETSGELEPALKEHGPLKRQLKNRHVAMISLAGVIGVGIFVNTATALRNGGPIGLILGFMTMGGICWCVMVTLGEMVSFLPIPGGHISLAERFGNKALSFTMGWNYWYNWVIVLPAELSAAAILIDFWGKRMDALWITICLIVVVAINLLGAKVYGECEFWFGSIKILTIIGLLFLGIILDLGGGPTRDRLGFRYWKNPGPFVQYQGISGAGGQFLGYWSVLTTAAFSFIGTEIVAIAAGEAKNPRRNVPRAIKRVYVRIIFFYFTSVTIISLLVPSNNPSLDLKNKDASASPFVIAIKIAGIKGLPGFINACLLTSAWSAASSDLYTSSRALYGLALNGNAPRIFTKTSNNGLPYVSVLFCAAFCGLAYMGVSSGSGKVFGWLANLTSICGLITWSGICFTYLRFYAGMKAQGIDRKTLPFASRFQPVPAWIGMIATVVICFFSGWTVFLKNAWQVDTFFTNYLPLVGFPIVYFGARFYYKQPLIDPKDMDFVTGVAEIELDNEPEEPPRNRIEAIWQKLNGERYVDSILKARRFMKRSSTPPTPRSPAQPGVMMTLEDLRGLRRQGLLMDLMRAKDLFVEKDQELDIRQGPYQWGSHPLIDGLPSSCIVLALRLTTTVPVGTFALPIQKSQGTDLLLSDEFLNGLMRSSYSTEFGPVNAALSSIFLPTVIRPKMPLPVSKKKVGLGRAIFNKRAKDAQEARESGRYTTDFGDASSKLKSVTQETNLDEFLNTAQLAATDFTAEKQNIRIIHTPTIGPSGARNPFLLSSQEEAATLRRHLEHRTQLRVPRRPPWTKSMTPAQVDKHEKEAILAWRRSLAQLEEKELLLMTPFERNLEVWRQLWRVLERSHLVVQIVDARNPLRFRCEDLDSYVQDVEGPEGEKGTGTGLRKSLLLLNKSDLLTQEQRLKWAEYFDAEGIQYAFFSALDAKLLQEARAAAESTEHDAQDEPRLGSGTSTPSGSSEADSDESVNGIRPSYFTQARDENEDPRTRVLSVLELESLFIKSSPDLSNFADLQGKLPLKVVVGLVGYPNVGKSSTINALLGEKKVSVSSTPGKTKHFQTIHLSDNIMLCDCPGLVFPQFATTKAELICDGVLPIDQMREYSAPVALVTQRIPAPILEATYGLTIKKRAVEEGGDGHQVGEWDFLASYAVARGFTRASVGNPDEARAARYILKDYVNGKLLYCHPPPTVTDDAFNEVQNEAILQRLLESKKKRAPTTRVGKLADTYTPTESSTATPQLESPSVPAQSTRSRALDDHFFESQAERASRPFVQGSTRHGSEISRNRLYPHQNVVANDGTVVDPRETRVATVLQQAGNDVVAGKKHFKPKKMKLRKNAATVGYD